MDLPAQNTVLQTLQQRFEQHPNRHPNLNWTQVDERLRTAPQKLAILAAMEDTGGEPDLLAVDVDTTEQLFCDFSPKVRLDDAVCALTVRRSMGAKPINP